MLMYEILDQPRKNLTGTNTLAYAVYENRAIYSEETEKQKTRQKNRQQFTAKNALAYQAFATAKKIYIPCQPLLLSPSAYCTSLQVNVFQGAKVYETVSNKYEFQTARSNFAKKGQAS